MFRGEFIKPVWASFGKIIASRLSVFNFVWLLYAFEPIIIIVHKTGHGDGVICPEVVAKIWNCIIWNEILATIIDRFRLSHPQTGHIIDAPVGVIGISIEMQGKFIVAVALCIVIFYNILSKHEAVCDVTDTRFIRICRFVVGIHFNISAIFHAFVLIHVIKNAVVVFIILLLVGSFSLQILIEEE